MKLGDHKGRIVTEPDFSEKFSFGPNLGIWAQNSPKTGFLRVFGLLWKIESLLLAGNGLKRSVLLLSNFSQKPHVREKSGSREKGQKGKSGRGSWTNGPKIHDFQYFLIYLKFGSSDFDETFRKCSWYERNEG